MFFHRLSTPTLVLTAKSDYNDHLNLLLSSMSVGERSMTRIERSITINAPADAIEAIIGDGRRLADWYLGVEQAETTAETIDRLLERRASARAERDFSTSDRIRDELAALGVSIEDGPDGSQWHRR